MLPHNNDLWYNLTIWCGFQKINNPSWSYPIKTDHRDKTVW